MNDRQPRRASLALTAAIALFGLVHSSGAQPVLQDIVGAPDAGPAAPTATFPAGPPPGAPVPTPAPRIILPEAPAEPFVLTPGSAAPIPTPAPRLIPPVAAESAGEPSPPTPPIAGQPMPPEETACRASLRSLGVAFEELPPVSEPAGCVIAHPIAVTSLSPGVALEPQAVLKCAMAEAAARFTRDEVAPAASADFGSRLTTIRQASGYVCRPRNGTRKLSEHAFGNALDFAAFELADGRSVSVRATSVPEERKFLAGLREAACGPFKTVLGPGSDADHATHFHFDLQPRRNNSTWCR